MKKLRVMVLVRQGLVPPDSIEGIDEKELADFTSRDELERAMRLFDSEFLTITKTIAVRPAFCGMLWRVFP